MKKVLFVCLHRPDRSPSQRFRFEQYLDHLNKNGYQCNVSWLLSAADDKRFYSSGNFFYKGLIVLKSIWKRSKDIFSTSQYDIVFVQRESFMLGTSFFEKQFSKKTKLIFDFDDSIWMQNVSAANKKFSFLKNADKTKDIITRASIVFAGNKYLADFEKAGMLASGKNPESDLVEIIEIPSHPFFIGVQYHPDLKSTVENPQPIFVHFIKAAKAYAELKSSVRTHILQGEMI
jgi:hypothetical protein